MPSIPAATLLLVLLITGCNEVKSVAPPEAPAEANQPTATQPPAAAADAGEASAETGSP